MSACKHQANIVAVVRNRVTRGQEHVIFADLDHIDRARELGWGEGWTPAMSDQQIVRLVDEFGGGWERFVAAETLIAEEQLADNYLAWNDLG